LYACSATVYEIPRHRTKSSRFVSRLDTREKEGILERKAAVGTVRRSLPSSGLRSLLCAAVDRQANTGMYEIFKSVIHRHDDIEIYLPILFPNSRRALGAIANFACRVRS